MPAAWPLANIPSAARHAFAAHAARLAGDVRVAQDRLGNATLGTTEAYLRHPTLDQLARAVEGVLFGVRAEPTVEGTRIDLQTQ